MIKIVDYPEIIVPDRKVDNNKLEELATYTNELRKKNKIVIKYGTDDNNISKS